VRWDARPARPFHEAGELKPEFPNQLPLHGLIRIVPLIVVASQDVMIAFGCDDAVKHISSEFEIVVCNDVADPVRLRLPNNYQIAEMEMRFHARAVYNHVS